MKMTQLKHLAVTHSDDGAEIKMAFERADGKRFNMSLPWQYFGKFADRSGPACLDSIPRFISGLRAGCRRCRVVHGGGRAAHCDAMHDRRGGQLGAHQRSHLMRPWPGRPGERSNARRA